MISAQIAEQHGIPADLRPLRRELLVEALDGAIVQAEAAIRFVEKGYGDEYTRSAVKRAADLFRTAVSTTNDLHAENKRIAAAERLSAASQATAGADA